jgi:hypothetical protein
MSFVSTSSLEAVSPGADATLKAGSHTLEVTNTPPGAAWCLCYVGLQFQLGMSSALMGAS